MANDNSPALALLIDGDNASSKIVAGLLAEIANYGTASVKRIYGDWSDARLKSWKDALLNNSIIPIQQYSYTTGKNATDSAMIIDAMDILYTRSVEGFCIVSSDSDYTRLASRIRESGREVLGFGEKKTPKPPAPMPVLQVAPRCTCDSAVPGEHVRPPQMLATTIRPASPFGTERSVG